MAKFIVIFALIVELIQFSLTTNLAPEDTKSQWNRKVNVTIYYETVSVETRTFFLEQFKPLCDQLWEITNIDLVPYGRTTARNGTYHCPYGYKQCLSNRIQSCIIGLNGDKNRISNNTANFVYCMLKSNNRGIQIEKLAENCAKPFAKKWPAIASCAKQIDTNLFTRNMAEKTKPVAHLFVNSRPVVKINNAYSKKAVNNLVKVVCDAYQQLNPNASSICEPRAESDNYEKVTVSFYYETHNHKSRNFAVNQLKKLLSGNYPSVEESIEIEFIPWGFTNYTDNTGHPFECAHGYDQCYGNRLHACVIDKYANFLFDSSQVPNFIVCSLEQSESYTNAYSAGVYCAKKVGFIELWSEIHECASNNNPNNVKVLLKMRDKTQKSTLKLTNVPWIDINNNHIIDAEYDLLSAFCKQYKVSVPEECDDVITEIPTIVEPIDTTAKPTSTTTDDTETHSTTTEIVITTEKPLTCNENGEYNGTFGMSWTVANADDYSTGNCPLDASDIATWFCGQNGTFIGVPDFSFCEQWLIGLISDIDLDMENVTIILETLKTNTEIDNAIFTPESLQYVIADIYDALQNFFDGEREQPDNQYYIDYAEHSTSVISQLINQEYAWSLNASFDIASIANKMLDRINQISFGLGCLENNEQEFDYSFESSNLLVTVNKVMPNGNGIGFDGDYHNRTHYSVSIPNDVTIIQGVCGNVSVAAVLEKIDRYVVNLTIDEYAFNSNLMGFFVSKHDGLIELTGGKATVTLKNINQLKFGDKSECVLLNMTANKWIDNACSLNTDLSDRDVTVCECTHLGYFAAVIDQSSRENRSLKFLITYVFAITSILTLIMSMAVTVIPSAVRRKSKIVYTCNISVCLLIVDIILIYGTDRENANLDYKALCETISILSMYLILSCFCWILIEIYEIFRDLIFVFYGKLKISLILAYIIGYFLPLVIIAIGFIIVDTINDLSIESFIGTYFCFFTIYKSFWLIAVPVIVIILIIIILLIIGLTRDPTKKDVIRIVYSSTFTIWFVITWIIYILYIIEFGVYLYYIFMAFKTILSFMIITEKMLDKRVRKIIRNYLRCNCKRNNEDLLENEISDNEKHEYVENINTNAGNTIIKVFGIK